MWDYTDKVKDLYKHPKNVGTIDNADAVGEVGSIVCGDALTLYLKIEDNIIKDAKFQTFGCGSAIASSSAVTSGSPPTWRACHWWWPGSGAGTARRRGGR